MHTLPAPEPPLKFPYSIVWTPIPVLSWLLPLVGHVGVCTSDGTILDFEGSYNISSGSLLFGNPTRYWQLDPADAADLVTAMQTTDVTKHAEAWDKALQGTKHAYQQQTYNFITNNCHNFACLFLTQIQYASHSPWKPVLLAAKLSQYGRFVGFTGLLKTWLPFVILSLLGYFFFGVWIWFLLLALQAVVLCVFVLSTLTMKQDVPAIYRASSI